jgi:nitrite reductase/ring-hydroxylating ferredoxin subunit
LPTAVPVGNAADVPEGAGRQFDAGGRPVAVFRLGGALFAMDGTCLHRGGPVGEGVVADGVVTCPWHGWRFEVRSGRCVNVPGRGLACLPVREEGGRILVEV